MATLLIVWTNGRQAGGAVIGCRDIHRGFRYVVIADVAAEAVAVGNNIVVVGF